MNKPKPIKDTEFKSTPKDYYNLARVGSGYAVFNQHGKQVSEENILPLVFESLRKLIIKSIQ